MFTVNRKYLDMLFIMGNCVVIGDTSFYRTGVVYSNDYEAVNMVGPRGTAAFDLVAFESELRSAITCNYDETA